MQHLGSKLCRTSLKTFYRSDVQKLLWNIYFSPLFELTIQLWGCNLENIDNLRIANEFSLSPS